ncbi:MAG: Fur family transcriptional regulator [Acidimicrobiales bacterium]
MDELTALLHRHGMRMTPQRQQVAAVLSTECSHPTVQAVYQAARQAMPAVSLRTVYQVLHDLEALDEVHLVHLAGAVRVDTNLAPHHHLLCDSCGQVTDVELDVDRLEVPLAERVGFEVRAADVLFHGRCAACGR